MSRYAIGALPTELIDVWQLRDGRRVTVRPVLPQDAPLAHALVRGLSPHARYQRFFAAITELPAAWVEQLTQPDFESHVALIAESFDSGHSEPLAEARYVVDGDAGAAEFGLVVADGWRRQGIARRLLESLMCHAAGRGLASMHGDTLVDNRAMIGLGRRLGFHVGAHPDDRRLVRLERSLRPDTLAPALPCAAGSGRAAAPAAAAGAY